MTDAHVCDGTRADCLGCAAIARRMGEVRAVMRMDDRLDDVTRARIWARLDERIAETPRSRVRMRTSIAVGVAAMAAAVVMLITTRLRSADDLRTLAAPAETTLSAPIGPHTSAALVGPARLEVVGAAGDATTVRLEAGTLLASFDGGPGRSLRIEAPGAVVDVVGTLFAVEVSDGETCVSVSHGRVRMTMGGVVVRFVSGGQRLCTGEKAARKIAPEVEQALVRHEAVMAAGPRGANAPAAVPATVSGKPAPAPAPAAIATAKPQPEAAPPAPTADDLYRVAESSLASHDAAAADRALAQLLAAYPTSMLVDQALYERARIAYQRRAWAEARRDLDQLAAIPATPLEEPGRYLACRIDVEVRDGDAARCLAEYRAAYPKSPHDLDVLGLLVQLAHADGGCAAAEPYLGELARAHGDASLTRAWRARCPETP